MKILKRIRGAIGMGLTWAAGWAVFGVLIGISSRLFPNLLPWDAFFNVSMRRFPRSGSRGSSAVPSSRSFSELQVAAANSAISQFRHLLRGGRSAG